MPPHLILFNMDMWHFSTLFGVLLSVVVVTLLNRHYPLGTNLVTTYYSVVAILTAFYVPIGEIYLNDLTSRLGALTILVLLLVVPRIVTILCNIPNVTRLVFFAVMVTMAMWKTFLGQSLFMGPTQDNLIFVIFAPYFIKHFGVTALMLYSPLVREFVLHIGEPEFFRHFGKASAVVMAAQIYFAIFWHLRMWFVKVWFVVVSIAAFIFFWDSYQFSFDFRWGQIWREYMEYWANSGRMNFGFGAGSFEWTSMTGPFKARWVWLHSDFLQILFEYGRVGFVVAVSFYFYLLYRVRLNFWKLVTLLGFGLGMTVYSPLQFFFCQILLAFIIKEEA